MHKIGKIKLENNLVLAPMAGITNIAFRLLCKKYGCGLVYSEMINANAIVRNNKATLNLTQTCKQEKPIAMQLFGTKIDVIKKAVKILEKKADIIDFNFGCPAKQIIQQGAGAALLKRPAKIKEIIEAMVSSTSKPVTAKVRVGITNMKNCVKTAEIIEKAGASAIAVHGRTLKQGYSGKADWNAIKKIKKAVDIPVMGNGDVFNHKDAKEMLNKTNCDFVMIGRGACGNPHLFKQCNEYLNNGKVISGIDNKKMFLEYMELWKKYKLRFADIKLHAQYFTKGIDGAAKTRLKLSGCKTVEEIEKVFS